jgi:inhibitor of Bruton tyrosine kinase
MAVNMETLLESQMLDDLTPDLVDQLGCFIRRQQTGKSPISRSNVLVNKAMANHADWLALQDIPQPIVRSNRHGFHKSPNLSPPSPRRIPRRPSGLLSPISGADSDIMDATRSAQVSGEVIVGDTDTSQASTPVPRRQTSTDALSGQAWKGVPNTPRYA